MDKLRTMISMKTYFYRILLTSFSYSLFMHITTGKEENGEEIVPARLAIIAIGPKPSREFGNTNGAKTSSTSALLPPGPNEIPPRRLYVELAEKEGEDEKEELRLINVRFNNPSRFSEMAPNRILHFLRKEDGESKKYMTMKPLEAGSMNLVLLRPTGKGDKRWLSEPIQYKIDLLGATLVDKQLAIINLSRRTIKSMVHGDQKMIVAGGLLTYEGIDGLELHRVSAVYGREERVIYHTAIRLNKEVNRLLIYVLYDANPNTNDGRTVGLFKTSMEQKVVKKRVLERE